MKLCFLAPIATLCFRATALNADEAEKWSLKSPVNSFCHPTIISFCFHCLTSTLQRFYNRIAPLRLAWLCIKVDGRVYNFIFLEISAQISGQWLMVWLIIQNISKVIGRFDKPLVNPTNSITRGWLVIFVWESEVTDLMPGLTPQ